ncbi:MAG: hypothetical protein WDN45_07570 [Caulobacteraceae bacterium]
MDFLHSAKLEKDDGGARPAAERLGVKALALWQRVQPLEQVFV